MLYSRSGARKLYKFDTEEAKFFRQYRLIFYTAYELLALSGVIIFVYCIEKVWYVAALITLSCLLSCLNLVLLYHTKNTYLCGHVLTSLVLITIIAANAVVGGISMPYSIWFYVIPLLAASLVNWKGVLVYSFISLIMILVISFWNVKPIYKLEEVSILVIVWANHLAAFLVIVTTLTSLIYENRMYDKILTEKNILLHADKEKFQHLSRFDQLTTLPNRQYFLYHLQKIMDNLPKNYCITVFFMDLDNFEHINDKYGHTAGDHTLKVTANRLKASFRENDFIARLGGDEFTAIVSYDPSEAIPDEIAKRIKFEFNQPVAFKKIKFSTSISIGLATYPNDAKNSSTLIAKADAAMYLSKAGIHHHFK